MPEQLPLTDLANAAAAIATRPAGAGRVTRRQGIVGPVDYVAMTALVSIGGSTNLVTARWLAPYVPVYLDPVWILMADGQPLIQGLIGPHRPLGADCTTTGTQTIPTATWTTPAWTIDPASRLPGVAATITLTYRSSYPYRNAATYRGQLSLGSAPAGSIGVPIAGRWRCKLHTAWDTNATGNRMARLLVNGTDAYAGRSTRAVTGTRNTRSHLVRELNLAAGDYIEPQFWQDSGADRTLATIENMPSFRLKYIGTY